MKITSSSFRDNSAIPIEYAFCAPDARTHCTLGANRNPQLAWSDVPAGAKSLVLLCHDPDVPSKPDDVNQEGRTIRQSLDGKQHGNTSRRSVQLVVGMLLRSKPARRRRVFCFYKLRMDHVFS